MKTLSIKLKKSKLGLLIIVALMLTIASCQKRGYDGRPGRAYISLTWSVVEPDYIDPGTYDIPSVFYWGEYYRTYPGFNTLYYESSVWMGYYWDFYAWEVDYEIWTYAGESGGYYYDGRDGADTYFTLELNPYGPYVYDTKSASLPDKYKLVEDTGDAIVIIREEEEFSIKATYKKVEPRKKDK